MGKSNFLKGISSLRYRGHNILGREVNTQRDRGVNNRWGGKTLFGRVILVEHFLQFWFCKKMHGNLSESLAIFKS